MAINLVYKILFTDLVFNNAMVADSDHPLSSDILLDHNDEDSLLFDGVQPVSPPPFRGWCSQDSTLLLSTFFLFFLKDIITFNVRHLIGNK